MQKRIYTPDSALLRPATLFRDMILSLSQSFELAWQLATRDIKAQYRRAALGFFWAFINPIIHAAVWLILNKTGILALETSNIPYPVFVFTGTALWAIFTDSINSPLQTCNSARPMLAKINFPSEALIFSGIIQTLFNAGIKLIVLICVLFFLGVRPDLSIVFFPLVLFSIVVLGTTIGLALTPIGMLFSDISKAIPILMQFLMYFSPIVFPIPQKGLAATIFNLNPLTPFFMTARDILTAQSPEYLTKFVIFSLLVFPLLILFWTIYRVSLPILIERMDA